MALIADVALALTAAPAKVLFLDTCDFLDTVQCVAEQRTDLLAPANRLLLAMEQTPPSVYAVISFLVPIEFNQNIAGIETQVGQHLKTMENQIAHIETAWKSATAAPQPMMKDPFDAKLVAELRAFAEKLIAKAILLGKDAQSVNRALDRIFAKRRPSHTGHVKDSIHLEHYLELTRQLKQLGFSEICVFASSNRADYWQARDNHSLHSELDQDFAKVGLAFRPSIAAALGLLGL